MLSRRKITIIDINRSLIGRIVSVSSTVIISRMFLIVTNRLSTRMLLLVTRPIRMNDTDYDDYVSYSLCCPYHSACYASH